MDSHYDILGVSVLATQAEISRAYRTLSLKHHPDKTQGQTQATRDYHTEKFKKINNSNEILSDPEKRITYDLKRLKGLGDQSGQQEQQEKSPNPKPPPQATPGYYPTGNGWRPSDASSFRNPAAENYRYADADSCLKPGASASKGKPTARASNNGPNTGFTSNTGPSTFKASDKAPPQDHTINLGAAAFKSSWKDASPGPSTPEANPAPKPDTTSQPAPGSLAFTTSTFGSIPFAPNIPPIPFHRTPACTTSHGFQHFTFISPSSPPRPVSEPAVTLSPTGATQIQYSDFAGPWIVTLHIAKLWKVVGRPGFVPHQGCSVPAPLDITVYLEKKSEGHEGGDVLVSVLQAPRDQRGKMACVGFESRCIVDWAKGDAAVLEMRLQPLWDEPVIMGRGVQAGARAWRFAFTADCSMAVPEMEEGVGVVVTHLVYGYEWPEELVEEFGGRVEADWEGGVFEGGSPEMRIASDFLGMRYVRVGVEEYCSVVTFEGKEFVQVGAVAYAVREREQEQDMEI